MNHIKKFNESMENHPSEEKRFTMDQLEAAFNSARIIMDKGSRVPFIPTMSKSNLEPFFKDFNAWFMSELGSSNTDMDTSHNFQDGDNWPNM